jgi:acyl-CoA synthetase (AMP-forming)/AMP-acid ligase II
MAESANIARHLPLIAGRQPDQPAIKVPRGRAGNGKIDYLTLSFAQLDAEVNAWVGKLSHRGVRQGDRVLVMVKQGLPLIAAAFALFKLGAVPVIIDPGMGRKNFLACVARSKPRILLGIPLAQVLGHVFRSAFPSVRIRIWVSGSPIARLSADSQLSTPALRLSNGLNSQLVASKASDLAAVMFTSGSTGAPKGVCYEHGMFEAQVRLIRDTYAIQPGEVDLPMLPIFALFNPALGMTTIVPEIDPSRPAMVNPAKIVQAILQEGVTNSFGSPTLWRKIFDHCIVHKITLPSLRRVLCAGAAVPASLWADAPRVLPNGQLHSPYGATEVLPVATVSAAEVDSCSGEGTLVGRPLAENQVKIIALHDGPLASLEATHELPPGEIGEIIVTGPTVTKLYDSLPEATALAKIQMPDFKFPNTDIAQSASDSFGTRHSAFGISAPSNGAVWHRMGDAGYLDAKGRLWFCGRIAERVVNITGTLYTEPCEQVFRGHPRVARCALIGLGLRGQQEPALVVQPLGPVTDESSFARELRGLAQQHTHTAAIRRFFFHPSFPVDVRHNAKIHRLTLAQWASTAKPIYIQ